MELYRIGAEWLSDQVDIENLLKMDRYAGGHDEQMKDLIKGAKTIGHWNEDDYQGSVATCVELPNGEFAIYNDYYGSCSGCDSWEDAEDEDVKKMCHDLATGAYVFKTLDDVKTFLSSKSDKPQHSDWFCEYGEDPATNLLNEILQTQKEA
jgi:hypothetical protein